MNPLPQRVTGDPLRLVLLVIAAVTVLTGLCQLVAPGLTLDVLATGGAGSQTLSRHLFATVGMFMIVVGGLLAQQLWSPSAPDFPLMWAGLQKFGAFALVTVGVARGLFIGAAMVVALFDLATAGLCWLMWRRPRHGTAGRRRTASAVRPGEGVPR